LEFLLKENFLKMKINNNHKKEIFYWLFWLTLVFVWNYGFPNAKPLYDVLIAVLLSILFMLFKKLKK
jgi:hypothetical protein